MLLCPICFQLVPSSSPREQNHWFKYSNQQWEWSQYLLIFVRSLSRRTRGSVGLLSWTTAGVFVLCWSVLPLSHLLLLISMETGPGAFSHIHTLAINQQVRPGSIPTHTHRADENKDHTNTHSHTHRGSNHRNIPEQTLIDPNHTSGLSGSDLATQILIL